MGDCDDVLHELYTFLDDETTPESRDRIRLHLEDCQPCLEAYDFEAELKQVIAAKCHEEVPADVLDRLRSRLRHEMDGTPDVSA